MYNVLHITNNYPTENHPVYGVFVKEQIDSLNKLEFKNEVFFIDGKNKGKFEYFRSYFRLLRILSTKSFDIVHCHHALSACLFLFTGYAFYKKCVVSYQNQPSKECGILVFRILRLFFNKIIFKNTHEFQNDPNVVYLPNGVNTDIFKPIDKKYCIEKLNLIKGKKYVLFFDSNNGKRTQKRYDLFQKTLEVLKNRGHDDLESIVLTKTPRLLIPLYINAAELHLLCSDFEGSPNSVKECMACNTKVVSTDVGNVKEMMEGASGFYVSKSNSIEELVNCIEDALKEKEVNGRENIFKKGLDIESVALKLESLYKCLR